MTSPITTPGIYDGIDEAEYHRDPVPEGSLSSTGAREMLPPSCPALHHYRRTHPVFKDVFDYGSAAHKLVLGTGPKIKLIHAKDWRTNDAKDARDEARQNGFIPLLAHQFDEIKAMAAAIQDHKLAGKLLDPLAGGKAEQSLFWVDEEFGVWCRARLDWLSGHRITSTGQLIVVDYKTSDCADPETFARKSAAPYGYHQQDDWYSQGVRAVLGEYPAFWFIVQEKTPPYLVSVVELSPEDKRAGYQLNRAALERFRDCQASGIWPGYPDEAVMVAMPAWARARGEDLYQ